MNLPFLRPPPIALLLLLALTLFGSAAYAQSEPSLPPSVMLALRNAGVPASAVGAYVQAAGSAKPGLRHNARTPMNPASVMKLLTTTAALDLLGPAHTWKTEALVGSMPTDGVLAGDLYLRGSGDPKLTIDALWLWLRELRARGLREIRGDVVLDRALFELGTPDPGEFDSQPLRAYNVIPDAMLLNFKAQQLTFVPEAQRVAVLVEPPLAPLDVLSLVKPIDGGCDNWRGGLRYDLATHGGRARLTFTGTYPTSCGEKTWSLAPLDHRDYADALVRELWRELGGSIGGRVRDGAVPAAARLFSTHESPPLADQIRDINKWSNNVMARQLFLTLGAAAGHGPMREADGEAAIRAWLKSRDLSMPELVLENGSGLSRRERISAESLGRLLLFAWASPTMPELISSLPVFGVDGTLKKRGRRQRRERPRSPQGRHARRGALCGRLRARSQRPPPRRGVAGQPRQVRRHPGGAGRADRLGGQSLPSPCVAFRTEQSGLSPLAYWQTASHLRSIAAPLSHIHAIHRPPT